MIVAEQRVTGGQDKAIKERDCFHCGITVICLKCYVY